VGPVALSIVNTPNAPSEHPRPAAPRAGKGKLPLADSFSGEAQGLNDVLALEVGQVGENLRLREAVGEQRHHGSDRHPQSPGMHGPPVTAGSTVILMKVTPRACPGPGARSPVEAIARTVSAGGGGGVRSVE